MFFLKNTVIGIITLLTISSFADGDFQLNSEFKWGRGRDGWGYCYEWTLDGHVLNRGRPVDNSFCERIQKSHYAWAIGADQYTYCYQFTPQKYVLNRGRPVDNHKCRYSEGNI